MKHFRVALASALLAAMALPSVAWSAPSAAKLAGEVTDVETQAKGLSIRFRPQSVTPMDKRAEHRLVDAQVLYSLKDYSRAAILLLDYVTNYRNTRGYPEALFFLADSLYLKRDFLSARRYFLQIVNTVKGRYYQDALQRLIELALLTNDQQAVSGYIQSLEQISKSDLKPTVPYVIGKYYYFSKDTDRAISSFKEIPASSEYYMHAQYFLGACLVRKKDTAAALKIFQELLKVQPKGDDQKTIRELTHLAVGRLLYDANKITEAIDEYQRIPRRSKQFDVAFYEIAWAYIKAGKYQEALRALDLLVLANPRSPLVPEVKVLQGNLLIRFKKWGRATKLFSDSRAKYEPVHKKMVQLLAEQKDPTVFFDALLQRNVSQGSLAVAVKLPRLAVSWVREKPSVKRALSLVEDVRNIDKTIVDAKALISRLEQTINSPARIKIYPEYAAARRQTVEVENKLAQTRARLLGAELALVEPQLPADAKAKIDAWSTERALLEAKIRKLPKTRATFESRVESNLRRIATLDKELGRLAVIVHSLQSQLTATKKYFATTGSKTEKGAQASFRKESAFMEKQVAQLVKELDSVRQGLAAARDAAGVGGPQEVAEQSLKARYTRLVDQEHALLLAHRNRLSGAAATEFDQLASLMQRCSLVDAILNSFNAKLYEGIERKLTDVRKTIAYEKTQVVAYEQAAAQYRGDTNRVAGQITYDGFHKVAKRFYDIIVRSDVGIIDVAWALKDNKTKEVSSLVRQQKLDIKLLDTEFKEVLKEK